MLQHVKVVFNEGQFMLTTSIDCEGLLILSYSSQGQVEIQGGSLLACNQCFHQGAHCTTRGSNVLLNSHRDFRAPSGEDMKVYPFENLSVTLFYLYMGW